MRTVSLIILGIVLIVLMHETEGAAKGAKGRQKKVGQKFEDCLMKAEKADPESDPHTNAENCKTTLSKDGEKGDGDMLTNMMSSFEDVITKVKDALGKDVGKKSKEFMSQIKEGMDALVKGFLK